MESILDLLAERASRMLDPADREALCGDLAESGVSGMRALHDVVSLVSRRRAADLRAWAPWLMTAFCTVPLGMLLSLVSRQTVDGSAVYVWLYADNWSWRLTQMPGFWQTMGECARGVLVSFVALACWSWTAGLLVGSYSSRIHWFSRGVFLCVLFCVGIFGVPRSLEFILNLGRARDYQGNAVVFIGRFYRSVLPLMLGVLLVVLPLLVGMRRNINDNYIPGPVRGILLISSLVTVGTLLSQTVAWRRIGVWDISLMHLPFLPSLMPFVILGPTTYIVLTALRSRRVRGFAGHT